MPNINRRQRVNYSDSEKNFAQKLLSSKGGRIIFIGGIILAILFIAYFSTPTKKEMTMVMTDNVMQCLEDNNRHKGDAIDDFVHNITYSFTEADTTNIAPEVLEAYYKYNKLESYRHLFYSTSHIYNNMHPEGLRIGVGFLGFVFSTLQYSDLLLDIAPVHKGYEQKLLDPVKIEETDLGSNPNIREFHYQRDPDQ